MSGPTLSRSVMRRYAVCAAVLGAVLPGTLGLAAHADEPPSFRVGIELPLELPVSTAVEQALRELGIGYVNYYVTNAPGQEAPEAETNAAAMALCERLGLDFSIACHNRDPLPETVKAAIERFSGGWIDVDQGGLDDTGAEVVRHQPPHLAGPEDVLAQSLERLW